MSTAKRPFFVVSISPTWTVPATTQHKKHYNQYSTVCEGAHSRGIQKGQGCAGARWAWAPILEAVSRKKKGWEGAGLTLQRPMPRTETASLAQLVAPLTSSLQFTRTFPALHPQHHPPPRAHHTQIFRWVTTQWEGKEK